MTDKAPQLMQDVARDMEWLGGSTWMTDGSIGDCACNPDW
jgi:hypothetical protein